MKWRWTFFLSGNRQVSINAEKMPALDSEWLTLSDKNDPENAQIVHMRHVIYIQKEAIK
jgi:hypothetical protein